MSLIALTLVGCTVHYWNVLYAFFFFFIGLAGWMADPVKVRATARGKYRGVPRPSPAPRPATRPSYPGGDPAAPPAGGYADIPQPA
jgi:hypothetical protein